MYYPDEKSDKNKIGFSVYAAAAVMELMKRQRDAVGLSLFSNEVNTFYPARSSQMHRKLLLQNLGDLLNPGDEELKKESFVAASLHDIAERVHKRSMIIIFSDMLDQKEKKDEVFAALRHLKHNKHEVILFHVHDEKTEDEVTTPRQVVIEVLAETLFTLLQKEMAAKRNSENHGADSPPDST